MFPPGFFSYREQSVIAVEARIAVAPIDRGHGDVERFARRGEVNLELAAAVGGFDGLRPELEHGASESRLLIAGEKAVAIKLDEDPIRAAAHTDARVPPPLQSHSARGVRGGQRAVVELRPGQ